MAFYELTLFTSFPKTVNITLHVPQTTFRSVSRIWKTFLLPQKGQLVCLIVHSFILSEASSRVVRVPRKSYVPAADAGRTKLCVSASQYGAQGLLCLLLSHASTDVQRQPVLVEGQYVTHCRGKNEVFF